MTIIETEDEIYSRATAWGDFKVINDSFSYSFLTTYAHQLYDFDGNLKVEVHRDFEGTLSPGGYAADDFVSIYGLGTVNAPVIIGNGGYLIQVEYPVNIDDSHAYARRASTGETESPIYERFMDVYNSDHELLYTFDDSEFVEELGGLTVRDSEGYYYSTFSNDLMIKKYSIVLN
jgi:hypothetical protein